MKKGKPPKRQKKLSGGPPKLSAYNRFVKRFMKGRKGKATTNMKAAAKAWRAQKRKPRASPSTSTRAKPKAKRRAPAKKGGTRRVAGFNTSKMMKYIRLAALASPAIAAALSQGTGEQKVRRAVQSYTGYNLANGQFYWDELAKGWMPYVASVLVTHGIPKLAGIVRGL